ncbi:MULTISPECIES: helix-turn-helix transcriptional regulator [unclassified Streptomyces]|uniref:helix-turn-helix domain-containing protein n=1 Tax=unclassified Streptomyces TaxID=2593676 RepID=UPI000B502DCE|nr:MULTISPECIES: helix-turn-helix transcriptional regulator [unclassified Streptomyces]MYX01704.1 helix-turn-helix domain-containing protein [Streptomyces sp. SID8378]SNB80101.1 Helix-turn-helix domain-containing protein [Streptomyces sp. PgraA7]
MAQDDEPGSGAGRAAGPEHGGRPEDEPGSGVMVAFGRQLKLLRIRAGMDRTEFGNRVGYAAQSVASFEQGRRIPQPGFIDQADPVLDAGGLLLAMKEEVARAQYPAFFRDAARLEAEALELFVFAVSAVPGLLQTEEYTRALLSMRRPLLSEDIIEQRVSARLARQEIFNRWPAPLLSFVIEEQVLRKPFGGASVLRGVLERVLLVRQKRNVEIQVMPIDQEDNAGVDGPFTLLTRKGGEQVAYLEVQGRSILMTDREEVRSVAARCGIIRSQALTPRESLRFVEKRLGEL